MAAITPVIPKAYVDWINSPLKSHYQCASFGGTISLFVSSLLSLVEVMKKNMYRLTSWSENYILCQIHVKFIAFF